MYFRSSCLFLPLLLLSFLLPAQVSKDAAIAVTATFTVNPTRVTMSWPGAAAGNIIILRHTKTSPPNLWISLLNVSNSTQTSLLDNVVSAGQNYEYVIQRTVGGVVSYGYAHVALNTPVVDNRGKVIFMVDSTLMGPLGDEIGRLKLDMMGDGWTVVPHIIGASATVQSLKSQIVADYNADPGNVKMVFLFGALPIPYSGNTNWDGHAEHQGAWPADSYYADVNGIWTDATVNNTTPGRSANDNVPGDGKFDQSYIPSNVELAVGRVDFRRLSPTTFGTSQVELYRRYLNKDHAWRMKEYTVENKAIVDDNFGYFNGEAFAANGFRNAYPLVGAGNVVEGDFFQNTNPASYLLGMGCGGGTYTSANGVGSSANFANDTVNVVFSMLFGSYHGDWDYETDPFMPAALASKGGILTCTWAGRPHVFYQGLASGETVGYCNQETQNAAANTGFLPSYGESGAHVSLLGDPTLRAHVVAPPTDLIPALQCAAVELIWTAPAGVPPQGYHVYRAEVRNGTYTRLTENTISTTSYMDLTAPGDTLYYQVRAVQLVSAPGGGTYLNTSLGAAASLIFAPGNAPVVTAADATITCTAQEVTLVAASSLPISGVPEWAGPGGLPYSGTEVLVSEPGEYIVTVTAANGCTGTATATVSVHTTPPTVNLIGGAITCTNPTVSLTAGSGPITVVWSGPGGFTATQSAITTMVPGVYAATVTGTNGCTTTASAAVSIDTFLPTISIPAAWSIDCLTPCVSLAIPGIPGFQIFLDGNLVQPGAPISICQAGVHAIGLRSIFNGCQDNYPVTVNEDIVPPGASAGHGATSCNAGVFQLQGASPTPNATYQWTGPNGFISTQQNPGAVSLGTYLLTVTNPVNGCTSTASVTATVPPSPSISTSGAILTCSQPTATIQGSSTTPDVTFSWTGPGGFTANQQNPTVGLTGTYILMITAPNGCTNLDSTVVSAGVGLPNITATGVVLDCNNPTSMGIRGNSTTPGVTYFWTGPNGFTSTEQNPPATLPGTYTLVVTAPNGCTSMATATFSMDTNIPSLSASGATLTCSQPTGTIEGTSSTPGVTYFWTGPGGFTSLEQDPAVSVVGTYTLIVEAGNGCTNSLSVEVTQAPPLAFDPASGAVTNCDGSSTLQIGAISGTPPYQYLWTTGDTSSTIVIPAGVTAMVSVLVTDAGGCSLVTPFLTINPILPVQIATSVVNESGTLQNGSIAALVSGGDCQSFSYVWNNGATTALLTNLPAGNYSVTVTCDATGCTATADVVVQSTVGTENAALWQTLTLSPNPAQQEAIVTVQFPVMTAVQVKVLDAVGRTVLLLPETTITEGRLPLDLRRCPPGMYTVLLVTKDETAVRKLAVAGN